MSQTLKTIQSLIVEKLGFSQADMDENKPMKEYGIDSLTQVELLFTIEEHFQIQVPDSRMKVETLQQLSNLVDELVAAKSSAA